MSWRYIHQICTRNQSFPMEKETTIDQIHLATNNQTDTNHSKNCPSISCSRKYRSQKNKIKWKTKTYCKEGNEAPLIFWTPSCKQDEVARAANQSFSNFFPPKGPAIHPFLKCGHTILINKNGFTGGPKATAHLDSPIISRKLSAGLVGWCPRSASLKGLASLARSSPTWNGWPE